MSKLAVQLILIGLILVAMALAIRNYFNTKQENIALTQDNSALQTRDRNTGVLTHVLGESFEVGRQTENQAYAYSRQSEYKFEEEKQRDSSINDWANQPIPQRLRDSEPNYCPYPCVPEGLTIGRDGDVKASGGPGAN